MFMSAFGHTADALLYCFGWQRHRHPTHMIMCCPRMLRYLVQYEIVIPEDDDHLKTSGFRVGELWSMVSRFREPGMATMREAGQTFNSVRWGGSAFDTFSGWVSRATSRATHLFQTNE